MCLYCKNYISKVMHCGGSKILWSAPDQYYVYFSKCSICLFTFFVYIVQYKNLTLKIYIISSTLDFYLV